MGTSTTGDRRHTKKGRIAPGSSGGGHLKKFAWGEDGKHPFSKWGIFTGTKNYFGFAGVETASKNWGLGG